MLKKKRNYSEKYMISMQDKYKEHLEQFANL